MQPFTQKAGKQWQNEVVRLAMEKVRPAHIAARLDLSPDQVHGVIGYARKKGYDIPRFPTNICCGAVRPKFTLTQDTVEQLRPYALKRGVTPNKLAKIIVQTVVREGLIEGVLDDGTALNG